MRSLVQPRVQAAGNAFCELASQEMPPLGTPDDVVHNQVYCVLFVLIVHVDEYTRYNAYCQYIPLPHSRRNTFHPPHK